MTEDRVEVRRSIDMRSLLNEAAELLWQVRDLSGAPNTCKRVEDDLRAVVAELDARADRPLPESAENLGLGEG